MTSLEEEEEEDLFVFNDDDEDFYLFFQKQKRNTIEGPGRLRLSQGASLKPDEGEGCSPVSG